LITFDPSEFFPSLHVIDRVDPHSPRLTLQVELDQENASCPACGILSVRLGAVRAFMAHHGIRGPVGSFIFMNLRLINDQTLENATGVGAPPWTWPRDEQAIDLLHKAIYAFATGAVADHLVEHPGSNREEVGFRHQAEDWQDSESLDMQAKIVEHS
jgi:hypothetical protein